MRRFAPNISNGAFRTAALLREGFDFSQVSLCNAFQSILEVFFEAGSSGGSRAGTHASDLQLPLGRTSGSLHEAVTFTFIAMFAEFFSGQRC